MLSEKQERAHEEGILSNQEHRNTERRNTNGTLEHETPSEQRNTAATIETPRNSGALR